MDFEPDLPVISDKALIITVTFVIGFVCGVLVAAARHMYL